MTNRSASITGWVLLALSLAYAGLIHHGVGAPGNAPLVHWWQPRSLFFTWEAFDSLLAQPWLATLSFSLPAIALALGVVLTTRSAVASTLAVAAAGLVLLCCFYGLGGNRRAVWGFFGWRASAVMVLFSLALSTALLSPWLARSWLARGWLLRVALYGPVAVLAIIAIRDVTGTDPTLPFAISPWPVVPMFALEIGGAAVAALLAMIGLDLAAAGFLQQRRTGPGSVCALLSVLIPIGIFGLGLGLGTGLLSLVIVGAAVQLLLSRSAESNARLIPVARFVAVGSLILALPILVGQLLVERDYDETRNDRAKKILDALDRYYARESVYPDALADLVKTKDLDGIPAPQVGFGVFETADFTYQNFGTNYLLEFSAPRWVQCAYNPPYPDDEGTSSLGAVGSTENDDGEDEPGEAPAPEPGSWTCPQKPPELW